MTDSSVTRRMIVRSWCRKDWKWIVAVSPDLQGESGTGATGLEPATFGFGDRRNAIQANGLRPPWGHHGDGSGTRTKETP